jgi:hypothetical protein
LRLSPSELGGRHQLQLDLHTDVVEATDDAGQIVGRVVVVGRAVGRIDRSLTVEQVLYRTGDRDVISDVLAAGQVVESERTNATTQREIAQRIETSLIPSKLRHPKKACRRWHASKVSFITK